MCEDDHMRIEYTFAPRVEVMQLHDDRLMHALGAYCDRLDVTCYVGNRYVKDPDRDHYLWRISGIGNVKQLVAPMRLKFIVKREQIDILLDDIIPRLEDGVYHDKAGFLEVMYYVDRLTAQNSSSGRKYTLSYFEELWGMEYEPKDAELVLHSHRRRLLLDVQTSHGTVGRPVATRCFFCPQEVWRAEIALRVYTWSRTKQRPAANGSGCTSYRH